MRLIFLAFAFVLAVLGIFPSLNRFNLLSAAFACYIASMIL